LLLILERPQRAECHLSLVDVTEHCSHKQQSLLSQFKRIHTRDDHALENIFLKFSQIFFTALVLSAYIRCQTAEYTETLPPVSPGTGV